MSAAPKIFFTNVNGRMKYQSLNVPPTPQDIRRTELFDLYESGKITDKELKKILKEEKL